MRLTKKQKIEFCNKYLQGKFMDDNTPQQFVCIALKSFMKLNGHNSINADYFPFLFFKELYLFNPNDRMERMSVFIINDKKSGWRQDNELRILIVCFLLAMLKKP